MIKIKIITPVGLYLEEEIESINVKTVEGYRTILPSHIPLVAMLDTCRCTLKINGASHSYALAGGLLQINDNEMRILTDAIEGREEIDLERARRSKERAEKRLAKKTEEIDLKRAEIALAKAINRIKIREEH
ncbi:ATP synthase F1 subunit epsilon [Amedibacillus sp. YH-ame10]